MEEDKLDGSMDKAGIIHLNAHWPSFTGTHLSSDRSRSLNLSHGHGLAKEMFPCFTRIRLRSFPPCISFFVFFVFSPDEVGKKCPLQGELGPTRSVLTSSALLFHHHKLASSISDVCSSTGVMMQRGSADPYILSGVIIPMVSYDRSKMLLMPHTMTLWISFVSCYLIAMMLALHLMSYVFIGLFNGCIALLQLLSLINLSVSLDWLFSLLPLSMRSSIYFSKSLLTTFKIIWFFTQWVCLLDFDMLLYALQ
uniref:Uncharacterized protein LOC105039043 n=1 Tax=Elaeis guineensis var. tenera TaxID=51953 RepID=A0A6I9QPR4_ELAGV|nr:uncharacterized protein LOC105039043 [Elaeis guineensis]